MRTEICLDWGSLSMAGYRDQLIAAESAGFDTLWIPNSRYYEDMWISASLAAITTTKVEIGTFVLDPFSQPSLSAAASAATLDKISDERLRLAVGAGSSALHPPGRAPRSADAVEQYIKDLRAHLHSRSAQDMCQDPEVSRIGFIGRAAIPIDVAGRGRRIIEMGSRIGDRLQISTVSTPESAARLLSAAGVEAGRLPRRRLGLRVDVCVGSPSEALNAVMPLLALAFVNSYPHLDFARAAGARLSDRRITPFDFASAMRLLSSLGRDVVDSMTIAGPPGYVHEKLDAIADSRLFGFLIVVPHDVGLRNTVQTVSEWQATRSPTS